MSDIREQIRIKLLVLKYDVDLQKQVESYSKKTFLVSEIEDK